MASKSYTDDTVFKKSEEIVDRKNNNENIIVLMKMDDSSSFYKIKGVATEVWELIGEGKNVKSIVEDLNAKYTVGDGQIRKDVESFLDELLEMDVISI
ncbi:MAG: hypothetical protein CME70_08915 [Halobacteriovorax sp.]|nr:hypothetical protein [Halobacteriovorax sp.]|tara:strand:- start:61347 stop:61640 length:294 start_codon:yes stop_codon:yes gene_type:complete